METNSVESTAEPNWQFSLKHLLIWLAVASVLLAPAHYFGGIYLFSIGCSLVLVFLCNRAYRSSAAGGVFVSIGGLFFGFFFSMVVITFGVHAFFNFVACLVLAAAGVRSTRFAAGLALTMFAVYGLMLGTAIGEVRKLIVLKANTPFESLASRLAFEQDAAPASSMSNQPVQLTAAIGKKLDEQDEDHRSRYYSRARSLEQLHEHTAAQFARAAGFGFARMPYVRPDSIALAPRMPLALPATVAITPINAEFTRLESMHKTAIYNFVSPERMGFVRSRDEVSGFESHGLSSLEREECGPKQRPDWQVVRLELVSLLRHKEPRVYIAESLPEMDKLADVPNRPLNTFEQSALPQLVSQKDVIVDQQPNRIEMLGALRTGKSCLECHQGERGKLLGAFSYTLIPLATASPAIAIKNSAN